MANKNLKVDSQFSLILRNSIYVGKFMLLDIFSPHLLVSGFGFHPPNIIFWVGHMVRKNGKESILTKKKKFNLMKGICFRRKRYRRKIHTKFLQKSLLLFSWFMLVFSFIQNSKTTFIQTLFFTFKTAFFSA